MVYPDAKVKIFFSPFSCSISRKKKYAPYQGNPPAPGLMSFAPQTACTPNIFNNMNYLQRAASACLFLLFCLSATAIFAQTPTQTLKGTVLDKAVKAPLIGATVRVGTGGAITDADGRFRIPNLPIGKYTLTITYLGYKDRIMPNVTLNAGKETDLTIELEESVLSSAEVVITAKVDKGKAQNSLSAVSTRTFSVEETQRFAAAVNDPARMVSAYAGVVTGNDGSNHIAIRGNAPNGLLWRMEGVDIPNPNHFSSVGTAGGGISILSAQLLTNSDFSTGAFAAEYGNALSGVFDLKLRKGNDERREYTLQAGVLGLDAAAEGPFRNRKGSYLVNYRYSTLSLLSKMGVNIGDGTTNFQDLSFNMWLPTEHAGTFTLFGFGGLSDQQQSGEADSLSWRANLNKRYSGTYTANTGAVGLTHSLNWGNTFLKTVLAASGTRNGNDQSEFQTDYSEKRIYDEHHTQLRYTLSSVLSHKFNARHYLRAGVYANHLSFDLQKRSLDDAAQETLVERLRTSGNTQTINAFAQWQYRPTEALTIHAGLHSAAFLLNQKYALEPRAALKYTLSERQSLSLGYGLHSQMQPLGVYFGKMEDGTANRNRNLNWTRAHHLVLSYDQALSKNRHLKSELYYQNLFDAPVSADQRDAFSMLNEIEGFVTRPLVSNGRGRNYGAELTLEQFLTKGFYFLLSSSLYRSEYQGSDRVWRNTRFNGGYASNLVLGKEWDFNRRNKNRTLGFNLKITSAGGLRDTPVDLEASKAAGYTLRDEARAFEEKMPDYFRLDLGFRLRRNYEHLTTTLSLDIQNATNRANIGGRYYDDQTFEVKYWTQAPLIPVLAYKVEF